MELKQKIEEKLRAHKVKPTAQRVEIGTLLLARPRHMSADLIISELAASGSRVSKATVYNTLNLFARHGLVREVSVDCQRQFYDSTVEAHHHFYNEDTGELIDIDSRQLEVSGLPPLPEGTERQDIEVVIRLRNKA